MARYAIYDGKSDVITPSGATFTAKEWLDKFPWGRMTKMIVGGGVINGSVALVFDDYVEQAKKRGCDLSDCTTDEEILAKIEEFEDNPPVVETYSAQDRIADALEDLAVQNMTDAEDTTTSSES